MEWKVPLIVALALSLFLGALQLIQRQRQRLRPVSYRRRYLDLVAQMEALTRTVNEMAQALPAVGNSVLLNYYETSLKYLENLLMMFQRIAPFGSDQTVLDSAFFLLHDCQGRVDRTRQGINKEMRGKPIDVSRLVGGVSSQLLIGCYFCSRPFIYSAFHKIRATIEGETKKVYSCLACKQELQKNKKIKVLFFVKDGQAKHWSQVKDYNAVQDFWQVSRQSALQRNERLMNIELEDENH